MKRQSLILKTISLLMLIAFYNCDSEIADGVKNSDLKKDIEIVTDYGSIVLRLSDETPKHRNNFIKLVNQKFYDSLSFHRIIQNFVIQTGDAETKPSNSDTENDSLKLPKLIDSEFKPNLFHKRGALSAARMGDDDNPSRSSSGSQFYIVHGRTYNDSTLAKAEDRINNWLAYNNVINRPKYKIAFDEFLSFIKETQKTSKLNEEAKAKFDVFKDKFDSFKFDSLAKIELKTMKKYSYPKAHREIYKTLGGVAHLDQNYTVFGEVVKGMDVVDSIAAVKTNDKNKPIEDVWIITARMIKRQDY